MNDDIDRIMHVMEAAFDPAWGEAWNRRQVADSLAFANTHYRLIDAAGRTDGPSPDAAAGFTLVRAAPGEEELLLVAVHPESRGRGLGGALLLDVLKCARARGSESMFLEMRENNPARALYLRHGFRAIGRRKDYYRCADGSRIDAITYGRKLQELDQFESSPTSE